MQAFFNFRWKEHFQTIPWYMENPANIYLSHDTKVEMIQQYRDGIIDLDSEAEVFIDLKDN